jgi:hypothetical protein
MSNPVTTAYVLRDDDELEGTLLLPVAEAINGNANNNTAATAALPISYFSYDTEQEEEAAAAAVTEVEQEPALAFTFPVYEDGQLHTHARTIVALAEQTGLIASEEERLAIRKGSTKAFAQGYHAQREVDIANANAKRRNRQGLQVVNADAQLQERLQQQHQPQQQANEVEYDVSKDKKADATAGGYKMGGYDVHEYKMSDSYNTTDYQVSQYKSVYD